MKLTFTYVYTDWLIILDYTIKPIREIIVTNNIDRLDITYNWLVIIKNSIILSIF